MDFKNSSQDSVVHSVLKQPYTELEVSDKNSDLEDNEDLTLHLSKMQD